MVKVTEIEVVADSPNRWVVRTARRQHPALVVQGDTFHSIVTDVESLAGKLAAATGPNAALADDAKAIAATLRERLVQYERDVAAAGLQLPYPSATL